LTNFFKASVLNINDIDSIYNQANTASYYSKYTKLLQTPMLLRLTDTQSEMAITRLLSAIGGVTARPLLVSQNLIAAA